MRILLREDPGERRPGLSSYLGAGVVCALTVALTLPLLGRVDLANIVLLFVLAVAGIATRWGRDPAVFASFLAVAGFDYFSFPRASPSRWLMSST